MDKVNSIKMYLRAICAVLGPCGLRDMEMLRMFPRFLAQMHKQLEALKGFVDFGGTVYI